MALTSAYSSAGVTGPAGTAGLGVAGGLGGAGGSGGSSGSGRRMRWWGGAVAATVGVALVAGVGGFTLAGGDGESRCSGDDRAFISLRVEVAPEIQPVVAGAAGRLNEAEYMVGGKCVRARVAAVDPAQVTTLLGQGLALGSTAFPDVWIPDSSLWTLLVQSLAPGREVLDVTGTSVARSPIVVAMPRALAGELRDQVARADPSWEDVLGVSGVSGVSGGAALDDRGDRRGRGEFTVAAGKVDLRVPDPADNATGLATLVIVNRLWAGEPDRPAKFANLVQTIRADTVDGAAAGFHGFGDAEVAADGKGDAKAGDAKAGAGGAGHAKADGAAAVAGAGEGRRFPTVVAPEQAVFAYNRTDPREPALAVYPREGTLALDYPFTIVTGDGEKVTAARLFQDVLRGRQTGADARALGFRSGDGVAPPEFGRPGGASPHLLAAPLPADVREAARSWYKLSRCTPAAC
jgi:hypothetical protein